MLDRIPRDAAAGEGSGAMECCGERRNMQSRSVHNPASSGRTAEAARETEAAADLIAVTEMNLKVSKVKYLLAESRLNALVSCPSTTANKGPMCCRIQFTHIAQ